MATFFKDLLRSATESEFPLAPFTSPTFFLTSRKKYFRPHTILKGLVQAVKRISGLSWDQETADSLKVGTMMATLLSQWLNPDGIPEPHPPNWRMDRVFRLVWTDEAKTEGRLESIPTDERSTGHRTQSRLEEDTRGGHFKAHPALRCVLVNDGPFDLVDDLAERLNGIVINKSENGTFGLASTHSFRQVLFSTSYHPSTPAPHHPPMPLSSLHYSGHGRTPLPYLWNGAGDKSTPPFQLRQEAGSMPRHAFEVCGGTSLDCGLHLHPLLSWPGLCRAPSRIPIFILIGTILTSIWRYRHAFVREDQAFESRMVLAAVDLAITQVRAQLAEKCMHFHDAINFL
ncbi:hypothetical protein BGZ47_002608 [Haplosporangium gracile]|nr:hypothetical protein BGZ47_002608 [Haplosporangium gracile]